MLEEVPGGPQVPRWRLDEALGSLSLRITTTGCRALGIEPVPALAKVRGTTKQDRLIALLSGDGITISELGETLGWLPHTVRAALKSASFLAFALDFPSQESVTAR